ncbi:MOSC N-terminal beta barrel domain-containing protein [Nonomuraea fuscirosea]|jgi:uncharacterized protein|uniref:MOSC domain-containing protein n=1 Tax=Nonomuraea fuscirosea TaxID=1291556 RepID=UPI003416BBDF
MAARVTALTYYPIKGCAGVTAEEVTLTPAGLAHDRSFMVVDEEGVFMSQRRDPRMALIRPEAGDGGARLRLRAPGIEDLDLDVDVSGARERVELFGTPYLGIDQGPAAGRWLTHVLGQPSRLVRVPPEHHRVTSGRTPGTAGFSDSGAVLVVSCASLDLLNRRLADRGEDPLPVSRFRPNIVVDGWDEPHTEDRAYAVTIGAAELGYAKIAIRCVVTTIDQESGTKAGHEPLRTLAGYRRAAKGGVAFGAKYSVVTTGAVAVGDTVRVTAWGASEL